MSVWDRRRNGLVGEANRNNPTPSARSMAQSAMMVVCE